MQQPKLTPELDVTNLAVSLKFYVDILGFSVVFVRDEEKFAFLDLNGVHLMLEEAAGPGRRFRTAPLEKPYGRGMNLQIQIDNVDAVYSHVKEADYEIVIPIEEQWYRVDDREAGNRQFVVADPDGYLLRFFQDMGKREIILDQ